MAFGLQISAWDGTPRRRLPLQPLGADGFGTWYRPLSRRTSITGCSADSLVLVSAGGDWIAGWSVDGSVDAHGTVTTAMAVTSHGISAVELDLGVVRFRDGRTTIVDHDRFDQLRVQMGYPPELIEHALATTRRLYDALRRRTGPFAAAETARRRAARTEWASASGSTASATGSTVASATPTPPIVSVG